MKESIRIMWDRLIDNPRDESTRLVLADMLEEYGDAESASLLRTGFIRVNDGDVMVCQWDSFVVEPTRFNSEHIRNVFPERQVMFPLLPLKTENE